MKKEIDHKFTNHIICPYCGYLEHDSFEYDDSDKIECPECEQVFISKRNVSITYSTEKINKS